MAKIGRSSHDKKKAIIASIYEIHVYEVFKLLVSILHRANPHESVNRFLDKIEVEKSIKGTKSSQKFT